MQFVQAARSDLQVCSHGTAAGNVAIVSKQLSRIGVNTWTEMAEAKQFLVITFIFQTFWNIVGFKWIQRHYSLTLVSSFSYIVVCPMLPFWILIELLEQFFVTIQQCLKEIVLTRLTAYHGWAMGMGGLRMLCCVTTIIIMIMSYSFLTIWND